LLAEGGTSIDFSDTISFQAPVQRLEAPGIERKIVDVGFLVKPKTAPHLEGAGLEIAYDGALPIQVPTNDAGMVATATNHPAGTGLTELGAMTQGQRIDKLWSLKIAALPGGMNTDDIDGVVLMLNYEFAS